jgi:hypothetical protein
MPFVEATFSPYLDSVWERTHRWVVFRIISVRTSTILSSLEMMK